MRSGKVVAVKDTQFTPHEDGTRREWKQSYTAIEPPAPAAAQPHSSAIMVGAWFALIPAKHR